MTGIQKLMEVLDLTEDEAKQLIADDEAIDKGEKLFELNADQKQVEKKMRQADRKVDAYGKTTKRERKADEDKAFLLNELFKSILPICETYEIANGEREFTFTYHEKKYKVVLSMPRN